MWLPNSDVVDITLTLDSDVGVVIEIDIWLTSRIAQLPRPRELGPFISSDTQKI